jgi:hypothetical protein
MFGKGMDQADVAWCVADANVWGTCWEVVPAVAEMYFWTGVVPEAIEVRVEMCVLEQ